MPRKLAVPTYRKRNLPQGERAYLTLRDSRTGRTKDYNLGPYGSDRSRELYAQIVAAWQASGCRIPGDPPRDAAGVTVTQLCRDYWRAVQVAHFSTSHLGNLKAGIRVFRELAGEMSVAEFGPNALRLVREAMIRGNSSAKPRPRRPWCRTSANRFARLIISIVRWGVAHELVEPRVYEALRTLEPLRAGQAGVCESKPIKPAPEAFVRAARKYTSRQVAAMIDLQLATGMRSGELTTMRPCDLDMTGRIWTYAPTEHKTAHHGHTRTVYLGPRAQKIIRPFLRGRPTSAYLFSPAEADAERRAELHRRRRTPLSCGNRPGTNRKQNPRRKPRDHYDTDSYGRAIQRACDLADRKAREKAIAGGHQLEEGVRLVPRWHPHQLRHNYATTIRREYGLEAAQILLGHSSALVTEAVYAERDQAKALEIAAKIG